MMKYEEMVEIDDLLSRIEEVASKNLYITTELNVELGEVNGKNKDIPSVCVHGFYLQSDIAFDYASDLKNKIGELMGLYRSLSNKVKLDSEP